MVLVADFVILNLVLLAYFEYGSQLVPEYFHSATKITVFVANAALFLAEYLHSTIIHLRKVGLRQVLKRTFWLAIYASVGFFVFLRLLNVEGKMFSFCCIFFVSFYVCLVLSRIVELSVLRYYRRKGYNSRSAIFVGNDPAVAELYHTLTEDPATGYRVLGYYADQDIENAPAGLKRLGDMKVLDQLMSTSIDNGVKGNPVDIDELFCCLSHNCSEEIVKIIRYCNKNVIHFYYVPRLFGEYRLHLDAVNFMGKTLYSDHLDPLALMSNKVAKRAFDIVVSFFACLCMLPFIPIIALIIKIQSPGPILFRQARTGLNGDTFMCLKFRSMHVNKDADKIQATKDDPRKFAFGNFMRKTNIDEFPQFFNVLIGNMSIVGPRPHMLHHTEVYGGLIDKYMVRHLSKPGITGWAQVTGCRGETKELWQMEERVKRDIWYIENWTFWFDIKIIFMTAKSIIFPDKHAY